MNENYGLDLNKEAQDQSKEDWIFGVGDKVRGIAEAILFADYLPKGEVQRTPKGDMMDCATRAPINILETKLNYLYQNDLLSPANKKWLEDNGYISNWFNPDNENRQVELSDAYTAIKAGTTTRGNSLIAPIQAIHKWGAVPKSLMPLESWMNWWDYHNKARITPTIEQLGLEFANRFPVNYERVALADFPNVIKWDIIDVAGYAWPHHKNGIYPRTSNKINHAFIYFSIPRYHIFDNYIDSFDGDFIKQLASDYNLLYYGYRVILNENKPKKKLMTLKDLDNLYKLGLFRKPDDSAQAHLKHNWDLVANAMANSPEHKVYETAINFLRTSGLIKFFDSKSILGRIFGSRKK